MHLKDMVLTGIFVLVILLRSLGAQEASFEGAALLEPAKAALEVPRDENGRIALAAVLAEFQAVTGWTVLMDEETSRIVEASSVLASGPLHAEPEAVARVVGALLANSGFCWSIVRAEPPRLLSVRSLDTTGRTTARGEVNVKPEDLPRFADHMALFVQTVVSLPNTDVRTLSNSLRGMIVDPNVLQIVPMGDGCEMLLQGTGRSVADLAGALRVLDQKSAPAGESPANASLPPRLNHAKDGITIAAGGDTGSSMFELVMSYSQATGQVALLGEETARLLQATSLGLAGPLTVEGAQLPTLFEELLLERRFAVTDLVAGAPGYFTVYSMDTTSRSSARTFARYVDELSLEQCVARPATLFTTVIDLPHTDVRTLSNSMRGIIVDPNVLQIIPAGNSSSLLVQGFGRQLVNLRDMLEAADAAAAKRPKPAVPETTEGDDK